MLSVLALLLSLSSTVSTASHGREAVPAARPAFAATCGALAKTRIEAAVGHLLEQAPEEYSASDSVCTYGADGLSVTIAIHHLTHELDLAGELANLTAALPGAKVRAVAGFADHAYALEIPGAGTQLHLLPGEREYMMVSVLGTEDASHGFEAAARLAHALLGR